MKRSYLAIIIILILGIIGILFYYLAQISDTLPNLPPITTSTPATTTQNNIPHITSPTANTSASSPLTISGEAPGPWFFEASFPIVLQDKTGKILAQTTAQATSDWMTTAYVPFTASLPFSVSATTSAQLIFKKDNPSGIPQNDQQISIPITLLPGATTTRSIILYYYNPDKDKDASGNILCSKNGLVGIARDIPFTNAPIQDAIKLLLQGKISETEHTQGITTEYPLSGFALTGASLSNGTLTLSFTDPNYKTGGGSCRIAILWAQIEATARQFPGVNTVRFIPESLFQP